MGSFPWTLDQLHGSYVVYIYYCSIYEYYILLTWVFINLFLSSAGSNDQPLGRRMTLGPKASPLHYESQCISRSGLALHASGSSYTLFFPRTGTSVAVVLDRQAESQSSSPSCQRRSPGRAHGSHANACSSVRRSRACHTAVQSACHCATSQSMSSACHRRMSASQVTQVLAIILKCLSSTHVIDAGHPGLSPFRHNFSSACQRRISSTQVTQVSAPLAIIFKCLPFAVPFI